MALLGSLKLEHVGVVVANIQAVAKHYVEMLGAIEDGPLVFDPTQRVNIQFYRLADGTRIELIEPVGEDSPVKRSLEKGGGLNHLCYEVPNIEEAVAAARAARAICICEPTPAVAFGGRRVAFIFQKQLGVIEFVEPA